MHTQAHFNTMSQTTKRERQREGKMKGKAEKGGKCGRKGSMRRGRGMEIKGRELKRKLMG